MNRLSQILGGAAVIAIAVVFIVQFQPGTGGPTSGAEISCAVEVRGDCIQSTDFWAAYRLIAPRNADAARLKSMGLRRIAAEGLYERWLLNEDAKRLGITVSDEDLTAELVAGRAHVSLPADKARQLAYSLGLFGEGELIRFLDVRNRQTKKFETKRYEREVRTVAKLSPPDFREFQKKELIAARMRDLVRSRVRVSEAEAFDQYAREKATRTIDYVRFDRRFFADLVADTSDKAVQAWADTNKAEIDRVWDARKAQYLPECRVTRHVLARTKPGADDVEAEKAKAKAKIERAEALLAKGVSFAEVARRLSDDTSAQLGGELGCVAKGRMVKPFEDKVFELKEGEVSGPVETEYGYHLIKVEKIGKEAEAEKLARQQIARELYLAHEGERLAAEAGKQVLAAVGGGKPLKDALDTYLATLTEAEEARSKDTKKDGARAAKRETVEKAEKAEEKKDGEAKAAEAEGEIKENEKFTLATHPHRPTIETSLPFNIGGDPIPSVQDGTDVARIAFDLAKAGDVPKDLVQLANGYAVVQLKEITPVNQEQWAKDRETYMSAMRSAKQNDAVAGYIRRLKSTLGSEVKYDQKLITEPKETNEDPSEPPIPDEGE
ncbi:MAG TPA: peptidylprolyl isomerase [Candidatus Nanopelagicales bacterium]|nr:peptidylprolyl isomerase [Candidatus Nanopelagicales bacterium]